MILFHRHLQHQFCQSITTAKFAPAHRRWISFGSDTSELQLAVPECRNRTLILRSTLHACARFHHFLSIDEEMWETASYTDLQPELAEELIQFKANSAK